MFSANDKVLESYTESKNKGRKTEYYGYWGNDAEDDGKINQSKFKGLLSIGVDQASNTLLVSCPEGLMHNIDQIVKFLDKAAAPTAQTFQVLRLDRSIDAGALQKKLAEMLKPVAKPEGLQPAQQQVGKKQKNQNQQQQNQEGQDNSNSNE